MKWTSTGASWFFGTGEIRNGKGFFLQGKEPLLCPRNFVFYAPPFSVLRSDSRTAEAYLKARVFHGAPPKDLPSQALLFIPSTWSLPITQEKFNAYIQAGSQKMKIEVLQSPSYLAEKAKRFLDENFQKELKIPELAFKLRTNPASLSREFQTQTGISLTEYHELLRETHRVFAGVIDGSEFQCDGLSLLNQPRFE